MLQNWELVGNFTWPACAALCVLYVAKQKYVSQLINIHIMIYTLIHIHSKLMILLSADIYVNLGEHNLCIFT
jgi:hypothetical protein